MPMKNVADILALAPLQHLMWTQAVARRDAGFLVEQFHCTLNGPVDAQLLRAAVEATAGRHPLLRACFAWEGLKKPVQIVRQQIELPWNELDWRDVPQAELSGRRDELLAQEQRQGFELTTAPLWRISLLRTGEQKWLFVWSCHHLIVDGWSAAVVLKDIFERYEQLRRQLKVELPAPGSFADYLAWLAARDPDAADQFWADTLRGAAASPALTVLPSGCETVPSGPALGGSELRLGAEATTRIHQWATQHRVGLSTLAQAAWAILLAHYQGSSETLFGSAVSGRPPLLPQIESLVGPLSNNIPLRIDVDWDVALPEFLRKLQQHQADSQPYEYVPLQQIARAAGFPPEQRLFDSLLVVENYPLGAAGRWRVGDIDVCDLRGTASAGYALTLVVVPGRELELRLLYDTQRFSSAAAARLVGQVATMLTQMPDRSQANLSQLQLIDGDQQRELTQIAASQSGDRVLDRVGRLAPIGLPGEIWTIDHRDQVIAQGQSTMDPCDVSGQTRLRPTGYRGVLQADGTVEWLGRHDAPVRIDQFGVDPCELTAMVRLHPLVEQAIVVPRADRLGAWQLAAFVVPSIAALTAVDSGRHGFLLEQLRQFMSDRLPAALVPRIWRTLPAMPIDATGEIALDRLPEAYRPRGASAQPYLAPADVLEARLCAIWSEVLGVDPVGVEDDFLDLGGHSSLAVALATRIENEFGRRLPLASLLERPTVAHLATLLRRQPAAPEETSLVPLRPQGAGIPLFCLHPAGGTVLCYLELARQMEADVPVYGLQAQGIDGDAAPLESLPEMAAGYLRAIKSIQPAGPYQLCGWSTGGVIAFELARQLAAAGDKVSLLALLDAAIPRDGEEFGEEDLVSLLGMLFPGEDLARLRDQDDTEQLDAFRTRAARANLLMAGASSRQVARIYNVFQANMQAVARYHPARCDLPLTILRAEQQATPMHEDPFLGWEPWAGEGIEVREVAGSHLAMLQQPAVSEVARILSECLSAALV